MVAKKTEKPLSGMAWAKQFDMPIYDGAESLTVTLTKRDIAKGVPGDQENCPIAVCIERVTGEPAYIGMGSAFVAHLEDGWVERLRTPDGVARQEAIHDNGGAMATGEITFLPVPPSNRLGAHVTRSSTGLGAKRTKRAVVTVVNERTRRG